MKNLSVLTLLMCVLCLSIFFQVNLYAQPANDNCNGAIEIPNVLSDQGFVCISGTTVDASPEFLPNPCSIDDFPTVWYKVFTDGNTSLLNINVSNATFESPSVSLYLSIDGCNQLQAKSLTQNNLPCVVGTGGHVEALGSTVGASSLYYIAVGSFNHSGGDFDICVSTISNASHCVLARDIEIVSRSSDGPLEGPYYPNDTVRVCMNVTNYTAANNGCQWFQGMIPVFGNGWAPSSFIYGQPLNSTINGIPLGVLHNGNYGDATWDWFTNVGYHHTDVAKQIGDFDGNGRLDMCNALYESDCPNAGGITGGCCGPCWNNQGDVLPGGWFAYGINGTCPTMGPPIAVDWGDGNTCGGGMGPWKFCFDLITRSFPDCLSEPSALDLSIKFFTTSDGETGSWIGNASVCGLDQPAKLTLPFCCMNAGPGEKEIFKKCNNEVFDYELTDASVDYYTWSVEPTPVMGAGDGKSFNTAQISDTLFNPTPFLQTAKYLVTGYRGVCSVTSKILEVEVASDFNVYFQEQPVCHFQPATLAPSINGCNPDVAYAWSSGETTPSITIDTPEDGSQYCVTVTDVASGDELVSCITLTVYEDFPVLISGPETFCENQIEPISVIPYGGVGPYQYQWILPGGNNSDQNTLLPSQEGAYIVNLRDAGGCVGSDTIDITIHPSIPTSISIVGDQTVCIDSVILLAASPSSAEGPYTVYWNTPLGIFTGDTLEVTNGGIYSAFADDLNGCGENSENIELFPSPQVNLGADTIYVTEAHLLDAGPAGVNFLWSTGDNTRTIYATATSLYSVTITDVNGCTGSDAQYVELITGIIPIEKTNFISLYPNPSNGQFELSIKKQLKSDVMVYVFGPEGKEVHRDIYSNGMQVKTMEMAHLTKGLYFIRINIGADIYWGKIVIQ